MKKKHIFQLLGMALLSSFLLMPLYAKAQKKTDFSGEWALNREKSELGERGFGASSELNVKQDAKTIMIERTSQRRGGESMTSTESLTMDGKENVQKDENRSSSTKMTWSGDGKSMTITSDITMSRQGQSFEMKRTEVWSLDSSGKILNIKSTSSSQRGDRSMTLVYDKK